MKYQLKLADGRNVEWSGETPADAIARYLDAHRDSQGVVAWRLADQHRHGLFALDRIVGELVMAVLNADFPKYVEAVNAVRALHRGEVGICMECSSASTIWQVSWPCSTERAIRRALGEDENG